MYRERVEPFEVGGGWGMGGWVGLGLVGGWFGWLGVWVGGWVGG